MARNIQYLETAFADAIWTDGAKLAAAEYKDSRRISRLPFPSWYVFKREPRAKQREAINRAYNLREFGFIMDPGTGKSQAIVDWCTAYAMEGRINAVVVIVPNSVTYNWIDELKDTCPIEYEAEVMDTGSYKKAKAMIALRDKFKWLMVSWESLSQGKAKDYALQFIKTSKCAVIRDESSWGKNHKSVRTTVATDLGNAAEYRSIATGTVVLKHLTDLYSQLEMLSTDIIGIGDFYSFRNRYCIMGGYEGKEVEGYKNVDELMELISPYVYVAYKRECIDIPPKTPENSPPGILRRVDLTEEQVKLYKAIKSKYGQPEFQ
ncbi:MAG TPA: SNF2-related protein, partial [Anaerolineae bacterium]